MSDLRTSFTGDSDSLEKAYQRIQRENVKLREQMSDAARESKTANAETKQGLDDQGKGISDVLPKVANLAAGYLSVSAAVKAVNAEIQHQIELQAEAAAAQLKQADPRASMLQNLGDISPKELEQVKSGVRATALKGYGTVGTLETAMGELASASPTLSNAERLKTLEVAARFAPQEAQVPTIAAGLADTSRVTESNDPMENLGVLAATAARSRATNPASIAEHTIPAAANIRSIGGASAAEALSLVTAIQNQIVDVEGRVSGTAATSLTEQLHKHFSEPVEGEKSAEEARKEVQDKLRHESHLPDFEMPDVGFRAQVGKFFSGLTEEQKARHGLHGKLPDKAEDQLAMLKEEEFRPLAGQLVDHLLAEKRALPSDAARSRARGEFGTADRDSMEAYLNREDVREKVGRPRAEREFALAKGGDLDQDAETREEMQEYLARPEVREKHHQVTRYDLKHSQTGGLAALIDTSEALREDYLAQRSKALAFETPKKADEMREMIEGSGLTDEYLGERAKEFQPPPPPPRPQTVDEQIKYMREHPAEREKFIASMSLETKPREAVRQLLRDENAPVSQAYESMKEEGIPTGEAARQLGQQQLERQEADPLLRKQRLQRSLSNAAEINKQDSEEKGTAGIAREQLGEILDSTGVSGGRKLAERVSFEAKTGFGQTGAIEELIEAVERRQQELEHPQEEETNLFKRMFGIGEHGGQSHETAPTVEEHKQAQTLGEILPVLREIAAEAKKTNELQQKQLQENANANQANQAAVRANGARGVARTRRGVE